MAEIRLDINEEGIGLLTLNAPERLNALNSTILDELDGVLDQLEGVKVLLVTGEGKAFVAGADIKEMQALSAEEATAFGIKGHRVFQKLAQLPVPVIGLVNGFALGGGFELALSCDFILASEKAKFGFPEVGLGIIPGFGGTQLAARKSKPGYAKELIFTARIINAEEAGRMGLVNQVVSPEGLLERGYEVAREIVKNSSNAVSQAKKSINEGLEGTLAEGLELEGNMFGECFNHPHQREGMNCFIEKKTPDFK